MPSLKGTLKVFVIILFATFAYSLKRPSFLTPCAKNDNKCALKSANDAIPGFLQGYKPFRMPPVDPFKFLRLDLSQGQGLILVLLNGEVTNLKSIVIKDVKLDNDSKVWWFKVSVDVILDADYEINGKILILPVQGKGKCRFELDNMEIDFSMIMETIEKNGKEYLKPTNEYLNVTIGMMRSQVDNLFNGDKKLGDQFNLFINENWRDVEREFHEGILELILTIVRTSHKYIFDNIPKEELFL